MRDHVTETSASPLACAHCGCTDLLYGIALGDMLAAAVCRREDAPGPEDQLGRPLWDTVQWLERGVIVCGGCTPVGLRLDEPVPAGLPAPTAAASGVDQ